MELYSVSFTTQKPVKKLDSKGNVISETRIDTPVTMHALPYATAMSYSVADNFTITRYEPEARRTAKGTGRDNSVGNGTKKISGYGSASAAKTGPSLVKAAKSALTNQTHNNAATGNMAGAINV